jgi:RNA-directed DNA polymerase
MNFYGRFYHSAMETLLQRVNAYLRRWAGRKYRKLRTQKAFRVWWAGLTLRQPRLFVRWQWAHSWRD